MCRHLGYLGPPVALSELLTVPDHSLVDQARAPRLQRRGIDNPDGWGVGWYDADSSLHRYRTARAIWFDAGLESLVSDIHSSAFIAAVRLASPGSPVEETGNAPFVDDHWLFSLNGVVDGFFDGVGDELRSLVSAGRAARITGHVDTEVLFALTLDRVDAGASPGAAMTAVIQDVERRTTGSFNFLLTDGRQMTATACGNSLFMRTTAGSMCVASEALDDGPEWAPVSERSLVTADATGVTITSL